MLRKFLRQISIILSSLNFRKLKFNKKKHDKIQKNILKKLPKFFLKNPRLSTHINLSNEILKIIKSRKLDNFLRNAFIQKIFFIHNRIFIFFELRELKKDKNWNLWKYLLNENDVGKPIRYFLYPESSGNRIRQVYIIKKFFDFYNYKIDLKKIKRILEIGGGYGCMADIFSKFQNKINYTIYDMFEVNLLQYYYLKMNKHNPSFDKINGKLNLINKISDLNEFVKIKNNYIFIANWSISEFPLNFRYKFITAIKNSRCSIISFQENFEGINNYKFFKKLLKNFKKNYFSKIQPFKYYNNAFLNENKHYILTIIKK